MRTVLMSGLLVAAVAPSVGCVVPIYSSDPIGGTVAIGANVFVQFGLTGVRSGPVEVEVIPPEGLPVHAVFDLDTLR